MTLSGFDPAMLARIRAAPVAHLGEPSLLRLSAFLMGHEYYARGRNKYSLEPHFTEWVAMQYGHKTPTGMSAHQMIREVAETEARAFELFFIAMDAAIATNPGALKKLAEPKESSGHLPVSAFLDVLTERPQNVPSQLLDCVFTSIH